MAHVVVHAVGRSNLQCCIRQLSFFGVSCVSREDRGTRPQCACMVPGMPLTCPTCGQPVPGTATLIDLLETVADGANTVRQVAAALYGPTVTPAGLERARRKLNAAVRAGQLQVVDPGGADLGLTGTRPALYGFTATTQQV